MSTDMLLSRPVVSFAGFALASAAILLWSLGTTPNSTTPESELPDRYIRKLAVRMILGLIGVCAGAYAVVLDHISWSLPLFAMGFGLWLRLVRENGRRRHSSPALRQIVNLADSALNVSLLGGVLIVGNLLAFKYGGIPIDLTRERSFSLSSVTLNQLTALDQPVTLTVFHNRSRQAIQQLDRIRQLLELYKSVNHKFIKVEFLDRYNEPDRYEALIKRVPDIAVIPDGGVIVTYGDREKPDQILVRNSDMFPLSANSIRISGNEYTTDFQGEDAITSALIRLRQGTRPLIAFTAGHGEAPAEDDPREPGLGIFRNRLESVGSRLIDLDLATSSIDPETKLLIIVGPKTAFAPEELNKLHAAINKNIPLLLMIDLATKTGLEEFLKSYQLEFGPGVVFDPKNCYRGEPRMVQAQIGVGTRQPIVESLSGRRVLLPSARPLRPLMAPAQSKTSWKVESFLNTSSDSWAESAPDRIPVTRDPKEDLPGPIAVGVSVSEPGKTPSDPAKPKLVVFSSAYLATNLFIEIMPSNLDLVVNASTWLRGRPDLIGISPKTHVALTLAVNSGMRARLVMVPTIMSMVVIIGLGVGTYLTRRV